MKPWIILVEWERYRKHGCQSKAGLSSGGVWPHQLIDASCKLHEVQCIQINRIVDK